MKNDIIYSTWKWNRNFLCWLLIKACYRVHGDDSHVCSNGPVATVCAKTLSWMILLAEKKKVKFTRSRRTASNTHLLSDIADSSRQKNILRFDWRRRSFFSPLFYLLIVWKNGWSSSKIAFFFAFLLLFSSFCFVSRILLCKWHRPHLMANWQIILWGIIWTTVPASFTMRICAFVCVCVWYLPNAREYLCT